MHEGKAKSSELIIFEDGTLYHIDLKRADNIPPNIILVGSSERVNLIAKQFDSVSFEHTNKSRPELHIITGTYKNTRVAAMSCGMGVGNMEIVLTELHALFEFDHEKDSWSDKPARINIIRVGTSGASIKEVPLGALAISRYSIGLDNLGAFYPPKTEDKLAKTIEKRFLKTNLGKINPLSYAAAATEVVYKTLLRKAEEFGEKTPMIVSGITTTSPGFFGPEGRSIGRIKSALTPEQFLNDIKNFEVDGLKIINHEMETSILFRMANEILEYNVGAICLVLDNIATNEIIDGAKARERLERGIKIALEAMVELAKK